MSVVGLMQLIFSMDGKEYLGQLWPIPILLKEKYFEVFRRGVDHQLNFARAPARNQLFQ